MVRHDEGNPTHEPQTAGAQCKHRMASVRERSATKQALPAAPLAGEVAFLHAASIHFENNVRPARQIRN
jgi:hypothetical protein